MRACIKGAQSRVRALSLEFLIGLAAIRSIRKTPDSRHPRRRARSWSERHNLLVLPLQLRQPVPLLSTYLSNPGISSVLAVTAALSMKVGDLRPQGAGWRLRLHEKGGKHHEMPCHHALAEELHAYITAAGIAEDRKGWLFRTSPRHAARVLTGQPMNQADAWRMIRRRVAAAGIMAPIGNHTFRATGITAYLGNGGALEHAQIMAAHDQAL